MRTNHRFDKSYVALAGIVLLLTAIGRAQAAQSGRPHLAQRLSEEWRFSPDPKGMLLQQGVTKEDFDDHSWVILNAIEQWQLQPKSPVADYHGIGWYRKAFDAPKVQGQQRVLLYFGGADGNAVVYLNGRKIGTHQTAGAKENYAGWSTPFYFDVTEGLKAKNNILAVQVTSKPVQASGLHRGVSLWTADSAQDAFKSLLANPFWAVWTDGAGGPVPAGWRIYSKPELKKDLKTTRVKTSDGEEGLSISMPSGNCNLFPAAPVLEKAGVYHFSVRLASKTETSVRARIYLPRPGEVTYKAREFYGQSVKLKPGEAQWLRFDVPTTEANRASMLYIYLQRPQELVVSQPSLIWEKPAGGEVGSLNRP